MASTFHPTPPGRDDATPPRRGVSLGWRLALYTSLIVTMVMGGVTAIQRLREIDSQRGAHEALLRKSLLPLISQLEAVTSLEDARTKVLAFHQAYVERGFPRHQLVLRDSAGQVVFSTLAEPPAGAVEEFHAKVPVISSALLGGRGTITVVEDASRYEAAVARQWRSWWVHMAVTVLSILLFLQPAIRYLVTRPLERLLDGVHKMEMGYWGETPVPRGAWEIGWLAWRFRNMGLELQRTVQHLVTAERRALKHARSAPQGTPTPETSLLLEADVAAPESEPTLLYEHLLDSCRRLESMSAGDPGAGALAGRVWDRDTAAAERVGDIALKSRLEDAALRILDPEAFRRLERQLIETRQTLGEWARSREGDLCEALEREKVPCVGVHHRVKHTAGVWAKMSSKGLGLEQVHDLFAFRVVVPTEPDCYWALGVIHRSFSPVVGRFRDYIVAPKENGYQSLHTSVRAGDGPVFEVQVRSVAMHQHAEHGPAAHWQYKTGQPAPASRSPRLRDRLWRLLQVWTHGRARRDDGPGEAEPPNSGTVEAANGTGDASR